MALLFLLIFIVFGLLALDLDQKIIEYAKSNFRDEFSIILKDYSNFDLNKTIVFYEKVIGEYKNISDGQFKSMLKRVSIFFVVSIISFIIFSVFFYRLVMVTAHFMIKKQNNRVVPILSLRSFLAHA